MINMEVITSREIMIEEDQVHLVLKVQEAVSTRIDQEAWTGQAPEKEVEEKKGRGLIIIIVTKTRDRIKRVGSQEDQGITIQVKEGNLMTKKDKDAQMGYQVQRDARGAQKKNRGIGAAVQIRMVSHIYRITMILF
jgi:hypothetical protein